MLAPTNTTPEATKFHERMRRYSSPTASTCGSRENTAIIRAGAMWQATVKSAITTEDRISAERKVSRTRSGWRAPKFCPATGATANPRATTGMKPDCITRMPMPKPAWAAAPNGRANV